MVAMNYRPAPIIYTPCRWIGKRVRLTTYEAKDRAFRASDMHNLTARLMDEEWIVVSVDRGPNKNPTVNLQHQVSRLHLYDVSLFDVCLV